MPPAARKAARRKVLVIDDNQDATFALKKMLELVGHQVVSAGDGAAGIALAREIVPQVILCDIGLPGGMSGYDFAAAVRSDPVLKSVYLVAVSGYGQDEDRHRAKMAGFDNHMTKPVSGMDLEDLLTALPRFTDTNQG
jgi:CheY-like chemotaxis protein